MSDVSHVTTAYKLQFNASNDDLRDLIEVLRSGRCRDNGSEDAPKRGRGRVCSLANQLADHMDRYLEPDSGISFGIRSSGGLRD